MQSKKNILKLITSSVIISIIAGFFYWSQNSITDPDVFAGNPTSICPNQTLDLSILNATITGIVTDGTWFTAGDGKFGPANASSMPFSTAVSYVPGLNDRVAGKFKLTLVSLDPDGLGPLVQVNDSVWITIQAAPALSCANNISISLNEHCIQKVEIGMLQSNPQSPLSNYIITLFEASGELIPDNLLRRKHLDKVITYKVGHQCTQNICWGNFTVHDYFPPVFNCKNDTLLCTQSISPDSLGFPFPSTAYIDTIINGKYIVKNWDACSNVTLEYNETVVKANCVLDDDKKITRKWKATDEKGNTSFCDQIIVVKRIPLSSVIFPLNYDDHVKPAFECSDTFPVLANGYPSPDTTGRPGVGHCGNLQFSMTDTKFELCGKTFKIVRSWFVIDWCTSESVTRNQIILVKDSRGPKLVCRDSLFLQSDAYSCLLIKEEIPIPDTITDCNDFTISHKLYNKQGVLSNQFIQNILSKGYFVGIPVGTFELIYEVTDVCNNTSTCKTIVKVEDKTTPYPVCDQTTKVSLDDQGKARVFAFTFDDGSNDNCGIEGFKVRKMNDLCGFGTQFGNYIDFCCAEIGTTQMVALEVTDIHGLKNTCMVEVIVEDKIKPMITCPPNITLECNQNYDFAHLDDIGRVVTKPADIRDIIVNNFYHNGVVGKDGLAKDNCKVTVTSSYTKDITCFKGVIRRKFVATDAQGLKDSCIQTISILNPKPFKEENITWPKAFEGDGCKSSQTGKDITGEPIFTNTACATVSASFEDQKFYIADGACLKIFRTWTVVDWCQFDGVNSIGKWGPYVQIIKLHNNDKPFFTSICKDTTICSYDLNCKLGLVDLTHTSFDSCTAEIDLVWKYELDLGNDGSIDSVKNKSRLYAQLPLGKHSIVWRVEDQCGNFSTCKQILTIIDCKKPTPYCITSLTLSLMQNIGQVSVWAKDFNLSSFDNCSDTSKLLFTFDMTLPVDSLINKQHYFEGKGKLSTEAKYLDGIAQIWIPANKTSGILFDCEDVPDGKSAKIPLKMTVTDIFGNQDFCPVELIIQDNNNACPDLITHGSISGRIVTTNNIVPKNTEVSISRVLENQIFKTSVNNLSGNFIKDSLLIGNDYTVKPKLNSDILDGVSTVDMVLIQRHILDLAPFNNPYKLIAADVNSSKSVTAADLVELRKLILGITDKFPKELDSWVFTPKSFIFNDNNNPYNYDASKIVKNLSETSKENDFVAIKIGDVNDSALGFTDGQDLLSNRNQRIFDVYISAQLLNDEQVISFKVNESVRIDGFQVFLRGNNDERIKSQYGNSLSEFNMTDIWIKGDNIRFLGFSTHPIQKENGQSFMQFSAPKDFDLTSLELDSKFNSEIYINGISHKVNLLRDEFAKIEKSPVFALVTNPISTQLRLKAAGTTTTERFKYTIIQSNGSVLMESSFDLNAQNLDEIDLRLDQNFPPGVYYIQISGSQLLETLKFIKIQ